MAHRRSRVQLSHRTAALSEDFGYKYACRLFGQEAIDSLPKLQTGPNKGKPKGTLHWRNAMSAGYVPECAGACREGGLVEAWIGASRNEADRGFWCGRIQGLAGSRSVLTQEYRDQAAAENARHAAEMDELRRRVGL